MKLSILGCMVLISAVSLPIFSMQFGVLELAELKMEDMDPYLLGRKPTEIEKGVIGTCAGLGGVVCGAACPIVACCCGESLCGVGLSCLAGILCGNGCGRAAGLYLARLVRPSVSSPVGKNNKKND